MVTKRKPAALIPCDGGLVPNERMQEAIEASGLGDEAMQAILTAWAHLDGHDVEVDHAALVAAVYDHADGLPSDEWGDFCAELGEDATQTLVILAMASCWRTTSKTLAEAYPDDGRNHESERLHRRPRKERTGPRSARLWVG